METLESFSKHHEELKSKDDKIKDLEGQIQRYKKELAETQLENCKHLDQKLEFEQTIEKQQKWLNLNNEDLVRLKDELRGKDLAIQALSSTLIDKGDEN